MRFLEEYEFWCQSCGKRQNCPTFPFYFMLLPESDPVSPIRLCRSCMTTYRANRMRELEVCREAKRTIKERNDRRSRMFKKRIDRLNVL